MRRLVLERGEHVERLHAITCQTVHPFSVDRVELVSVDDVLDAARAGCCEPTLDEWRLAVLDASGSQRPAPANVARSSDTCYTARRANSTGDGVTQARYVSEL